MYMSIIFKHFLFETNLHIKVKFYVEPLWGRETLIYKNGLGHMTKMATMPICVQNLHNFLLRNQKFNDLETFYCKVKFG